MPRGDRKHEHMYEELVSILGPDYVEDDPAIVEALNRDTLTTPIDGIPRVEFIVLPGCTEDVQQVFKLANRLKFPVSISSTGLFVGSCGGVEGKTHWVFIDPKRMDHMEIDEKNKIVIVEPYVSHAQVMAESMKIGAFVGTPGASGQTSELAGHVFQNINWVSWRTGAGRNIVGAEWVLPSGDVLRTGALANPKGRYHKGYYIGDGPGPDLRGLLRAHVGHLGALGAVTRLAVKLQPYPGPPVFPTQGVQPEKQAVLPPNRFRTFVFGFPSLEKCVNAIREMGKAEIAAWVIQFAPYDFVFWASKSREEFWEKWENQFWKSIRQMKGNAHLVCAGLWAYASEKQLDYEERVLREIIKENHGDFIPEEEYEFVEPCLTPNIVRDTHRCRFMRLGRTCMFASGVGSLKDILITVPMGTKLKEKYVPPFGDPGLEQHKFWPLDFGRMCFLEVDTFGERSEECDELKEKVAIEEVETSVKEKHWTMPFAMLHAQVGGHYFNVDKLVGQIKQDLDPNDVANPTRVINMDFMKARQKGAA